MLLDYLHRNSRQLCFNDDTLSPLLRLKSLQGLDLSHMTVNISGDAYWKMGPAWPRITMLRLGDSREGVDAAWVELEDLLVLAELGPNLETLGVRLARLPEPSFFSIKLGGPVSRIKFLLVCAPRFASVDESDVYFAALSIFPHLHNIELN